MKTSTTSRSFPRSLFPIFLALGSLASCGGGGGGGGVVGPSAQAQCMTGTWYLLVEGVGGSQPCVDLGLDGAQLDFTAVPAVNVADPFEALIDWWAYYMDSPDIDLSLPGQPVTKLIAAWSVLDGGAYGLTGEIEGVYLDGLYYLPESDITIEFGGDSGESATPEEWASSAADCTAFSTIQGYAVYNGNVVDVLTYPDGSVDVVPSEFAFPFCTGKVLISASRNAPLASSPMGEDLVPLAGQLQLDEGTELVPVYGLWSDSAGTGSLWFDAGAPFGIWRDERTVQVLIPSRLQPLVGQMSERAGAFEGVVTQQLGDGAQRGGLLRLERVER